MMYFLDEEVDVATITRPQNARSRRTRAALLDAARELIEHDGVERLTMAGVADVAGVSRRAVYLHFASRAELLTALYSHLGEVEQLRTSFQAVWDCADGASALEEWAHHIARAHPRILGVARAIEIARHSDPEAAAWHDVTSRNWYASCTRLASWLERDDALAGPWTTITAADALWGLMSWDLLERLMTIRGWSSSEFGDRLAVMLLATFARQGRPGPAAS